MVPIFVIRGGIRVNDDKYIRCLHIYVDMYVTYQHFICEFGELTNELSCKEAKDINTFKRMIVNYIN